MFVGLIWAAASARAGTSLVGHADVWHYRKGNAGPLQSDWKTTPDAKLDGTWLTGRGGFGMSDDTYEISLCQTILADMRGNYSTLAYRKSFDVSSPVDANLHLMLTMDWDDGFIAWLDGVYLASEGSPNAPAEPPVTGDAKGGHESSRGDDASHLPVTYDLGVVGTRLSVGTHVMSVIGLNSSLSGSGDFVQIADLTLGAYTPPLSNCFRGLVLTNTTWYATNSPVVVCGDLTIASGVALTIEPGTTVQIATGINLFVANGGALLAEGVATNRIRFTRAPDNTSVWSGITVYGEPGSPETRIAYADIEFNGSTAIHSSGGTVYLDHLVFGTMERQYVSLDYSSFIVSNCVFPAGAVGFELAHGDGGIKPGGHGIFLRNFFGGTIGYNDGVDFTGGKRPGPIVHFIENVISSTQDDGLDIDGTDAWIEGNIFMHVHRNGGTPDTATAISGGNYSGYTSQITIIGNLFFDCDNAIMAKEGNFYTLLNNTIVHTTNVGGVDFDSGVIAVRDTTPALTTFAAGCYLEGNIIVDAPQLVRNYDATQTVVTLTNNILPLAWDGPGAGNLVADPKLTHIPQLAETVFTNWAQAQIFRTWFALQPGSPAIGTGPNGRDKGGVIPLGASLSGEPKAFTTEKTASLDVGSNHSGNGITTSGWPEGAGYTHYKWRLDGSGGWSDETRLNSPILLTNLLPGTHFVEVTGKRDSGLYQDDLLFGAGAVTTRSLKWIVGEPPRIEQFSLVGSDTLEIRFTGQPNVGYSIQYRNSLVTGTWETYLHLDPVPIVHEVTVPLPILPEAPMRFYRIVMP